MMIQRTTRKSRQIVLNPDFRSFKVQMIPTVVLSRVSVPMYSFHFLSPIIILHLAI